MYTCMCLYFLYSIVVFIVEGEGLLGFFFFLVTILSFNLCFGVLDFFSFAEHRFYQLFKMPSV